MSVYKRLVTILPQLLALLMAVAFIGYHVLLEQYYCLSADDFSGIDYASDGIPGFSYAYHFYWRWEGPFLSHFLHGLFMRLVSVGVPAWIILLFSKLGIIGSNAVLLIAISNRFKLSWAKIEVFFTSTVFVSVLYLISPNKTEIWHWLTGMFYVIPLISLQLGAAALISKRFFLAVIALAVLVQSRATYSVLAVGFIGVLVIWNWIVRSPNKKKWLLTSLALAVLLSIYLIAPGNYVRLKEHGNELPFLISQFKIGLHNLFISYNVAKGDRILLGLLAVLPFLTFGTQTLIPQKRWHWFVPAVLYIGFALAHETIFVLVTGYCEWTRVLSLHAYLFLTTCAVYGFWFFQFIPEGWRVKMRLVSGVATLLLIAKFADGFASQLDQGQELKSSYSKRMEVILNHEGKGDTLYVQPMSYNGLLYFSDFSTDPDNWINKDFIKAYNLEFKIAIDENETK